MRARSIVFTGIANALVVLTLTTLFTAAPVVNVRASDFPHQWSQRFGDALNSQLGITVATDASGNVLVAGIFRGTVNFGGSDLTSEGEYDLFIAKFSSSGVHQWSQRFGDASEQGGLTLATDWSGSVVVAGSFQGTVNFGGSDLTSAGYYDVFVAKFNSSGVHQWSQRFGDVLGQDIAIVKTDVSGNVVVAGSFQGTINFGGSDLTSAGNYDVYVAKFNSSGVHQWSKRFGDGTIQIGATVATDAAGSVIVTGYFLGSVNFGGSLLISAGDYDIFVVKFNHAGNHQWSQRFGGGDYQYGTSVATDGSGNVIVGGYFYGSLSFGGTSLVSVDGTDIYVAAFNSAGVHQWSQSFGDADDQFASSVATDVDGNVLVTGGFNGTVNFGDSDLTSVGGADIYLAKFSSSGLHLMSQQFGDAADQYGHSVATDAAGDVVLTGQFDGTVNFGGMDLTDVGGFTDMFLAKLGGSVTGVDDARAVFGLSVSGYPNPFNPSTTIRYTLPLQGRVTIAVHDARGARVATLVDDVRDAGDFTVPWNGRSDNGTLVSSGVYFARVAHAGETKSYKMVLLK